MVIAEAITCVSAPTGTAHASERVPVHIDPRVDMDLSTARPVQVNDRH
ncbi:MAG: hypothetical protein WB441_04500 [Nocardioidaceae bacterium]